MKMTSHGQIETELLKKNLESQLDRLVEQLQDLEDSKDELDADEYCEARLDTVSQLEEFNESLGRLTKGDISLVNSIGAMQLTIQAAISKAFKTPEVLRLFGKRQPEELKDRLKTLENDRNLKTISNDAFERQKAEILVALRQLGEQLSVDELQFLEKHNDIANAFKNVEFVEVNE